MTTKETFLSLGVGSLHQETADKIDFDALDKFVTMFVTSYINTRGGEMIKQELSWALYGLMEWVVSHINPSRNQEGYVFSLVSLNLMNFVNRKTVE